MNRAIILFPILSGLAFTIAVSALANADEMLSQNDPSSSLALFLRIGGLFLFSLLTLGFATRSLVVAFKRRWSQFSLLAACALISAGSPFTAALIAEPISQNAKIRYIDRFGREALRVQVAALVEERSSITGPQSYLGKVVAVEDIPPLILEFARGNEIELSEEGVVVRTHGFGSWRGGYLVTPQGLDREPSFTHKKILEGFYYVQSN